MILLWVLPGKEKELVEELEQEGFHLHSVSSLECCVVVQVKSEHVDGVSKHLRVRLDRDKQNKHLVLECTVLDSPTPAHNRYDRIERFLTTNGQGEEFA